MLVITRGSLALRFPNSYNLHGHWPGRPRPWKSDGMLPQPRKSGSRRVRTNVFVKFIHITPLWCVPSPDFKCMLSPVLVALGSSDSAVSWWFSPFVTKLEKARGKTKHHWITSSYLWAIPFIMFMAHVILWKSAPSQMVDNQIRPFSNKLEVIPACSGWPMMPARPAPVPNCGHLWNAVQGCFLGGAVFAAIE